MFDGIFGMIEKWIIGKLLEFCSTVISLVNAISISFFDNELIKIVLAFFGGLSLIIFASSLVFMLFDVVEEVSGSKTIEWGTVFINCTKALCFILVVPPGVMLSMDIGNNVIDILGVGAINNSLSDMVSGGLLGMLGGGTFNFMFTLLIALLLAVGITFFFYISLLRFGNMFVQIMIANLYIPDIVRGNTESMGDWLRQTIAIAITYLIQYLLFALGLNFIVDKGFTPEHMGNFLLGISLWITMFGVSKLLNKFGMSSGVKGVVSSATSTATSMSLLFR